MHGVAMAAEAKQQLFFNHHLLYAQAHALQLQSLPYMNLIICSKLSLQALHCFPSKGIQAVPPQSPCSHMTPQLFDKLGRTKLIHKAMVENIQITNIA